MVATAEKQYTKKWDGIVGVTIRDLTDDIIHALRIPMDMELNENPEVEKMKAPNLLGREATIGLNQKGVDPELTLTYSGRNTELYALSRGRKMIATANLAGFIPRNMQVSRGTYAAVASGKLGFGVAADADVEGSAISGTSGLRISLTRQPFATFDPISPNSFAIGANFARKFSDDLVTRRAYVHLLIPNTFTNVREVSEEVLGPQEIIALIRNSDDATLTYVTAPNATIDPSGNAINPKADNTAIKFILSSAGRCEAFSIFDVDQELFCDAA